MLSDWNVFRGAQERGPSRLPLKGGIVCERLLRRKGGRGGDEEKNGNMLTVW